MNNKNEIIIFENQNVKLEVNMKDETVWLSQEQMSKLFDRDRTTILRHINNIFKTKELNKKEVCANFAHTSQQEMANKSNVLRDKIAKIERGIYPPNIKSLLKILGPLGYTIKIEKIKEEINE